MEGFRFFGIAVAALPRRAGFVPRLFVLEAPGGAVLALLAHAARRSIAARERVRMSAKSLPGGSEGAACTSSGESSENDCDDRSCSHINSQLGSPAEALQRVPITATQLQPSKLLALIAHCQKGGGAGILHEWARGDSPLSQTRAM